MLDPETIIEKLKLVEQEMDVYEWHRAVGLGEAVREAIALIERATSPMTLEECCGILNANKHLYSRWEKANPGEWWEVYDDVLVKGEAFHTRFEAETFARAFLMKIKSREKEAGDG